MWSNILLWVERFLYVGTAIEMAAGGVMVAWPHTIPTEYNQWIAYGMFGLAALTLLLAIGVRKIRESRRTGAPAERNITVGGDVERSVLNTGDNTTIVQELPARSYTSEMGEKIFGPLDKSLPLHVDYINGDNESYNLATAIALIASRIGFPIPIHRIGTTIVGGPNPTGITSKIKNGTKNVIVVGLNK